MNGRRYALGGARDNLVAGNSDGATDRGSTVEGFDPATGFWTPRAVLPQPRHDDLAVTLGDRIYIIGGGYWHFDIGNGEWNAIREVYAFAPPTILFVHEKVSE